MLGLSAPTFVDGIKSSKGNGKVTLVTDSISVEITGGSNIPAFFYWNINDPNTTYRVSFDSMFEMLDQNSNGEYDLGTDKMVPATTIALASYDWEFSDINDDNTTIHFNITSIGAHGAQTGPTIQFRIHLTSSDANELKFDIVIDNYEFSDANAYLVLSFKVTVSERNKEQNQEMHRSQNKNETRYGYGNGYFGANETATANNSTVGVGLSSGNDSGSSKIYIAYEHFDGKMIHDPVIGVSTTSSSSDQNIGDTDTSITIIPILSKGQLLGTTLIATTLFLIIPVILRKFKK